MADFLTGSICLTDIPKEQIQLHKNGKKYLNFVVAKRQEVGQYGETHTIYISQSEEERAAKLPKHYIGNCKERNTQFSKQVAPAEIQQAAPVTVEQVAEMPAISAQDVDDLPF